MYYVNQVKDAPLSADCRQLTAAVERFVAAHRLIPPGETVLVAVSGGADSVCLLHLLAGLRNRLGIVVRAAHLNHRLRGAESDGDVKYVSRLAGRLGVPLTTGSRDVLGYQAERRLSLEDAARQVRYRFLADVAGKVGAQRVAVGHTADDQAETILMHLVRGAGPAGLAGMSPSSTWTSPGLAGFTVVRPLLGVKREATHRYCRGQRLRPRADSSNSSSSPLRNRVRQELMPLLQAYNPRAGEALVRTAETLGADLSFLEECVTGAWPGAVRVEDAAIVFDRHRVLALHPAVQRHLLRRAIREVLGDLEDIEWKHIEQMRRGLTLRKGKRVVLPRKLVLSVEGRSLRLRAVPAAPPGP